METLDVAQFTVGDSILSVIASPLKRGVAISAAAITSLLCGDCHVGLRPPRNDRKEGPALPRRSLLALLSGTILTGLTFSTSWADPLPVGSVRGCIRPPLFVQKYGIRAPAFSTTHRITPGLILQDSAQLAATGSAKIIQEPSWQSAGRLGPIAFDRAGNIYSAPVPHVNVQGNPLERQNTIYRVGTSDGELKEFFSIPVKSSPSARNPFGVTGLSYDCDTDILYATTLSGSTAKEQLGSVVGLSLRNNQIVTRLDGIDAIAISPFNSATGKVLYLGSARRSDIISLALDKDGKIAGDPKTLLSFDKFHETKARKITIDKALLMTVETTEFNYNLIASTELTQRSFKYRYDPGQDAWLAAN